MSSEVLTADLGCFYIGIMIGVNSRLIHHTGGYPSVLLDRLASCYVTQIVNVIRLFLKAKIRDHSLGGENPYRVVEVVTTAIESRSIDLSVPEEHLSGAGHHLTKVIHLLPLTLAKITC